MQVVGTTSVDVARRPGAVVVALAGDAIAFVLGQVWRMVRGGAAVVRGRAIALHRRSPVRTLVAASTRVRRAPQLVVVGGAQTAVTGPRLVTYGPATGYARATVPGPHELVLPADATAPRRARALLQAAAQDWDVDDDLYQDAAMVVTELVANAVDHARTPSTLTVGLDERGGLCLAVRDTCPTAVPRPRPVDPAAPRGRGLQMIAALASAWGVTTHIDGKTVWAVLRRA